MDFGYFVRTANYTVYLTKNNNYMLYFKINYMI